MERFEFVVGSQEAGVRLDAFLAEKCGLTRSRVQALAENGHVLLGGAAPAKMGVRVAEGDAVSLTVPEAVPLEAIAQDIPLSIVYQDEDVAVIDKPRGMVVHPAPGHAQGTLVNALLAACQGLSGIGGALRPGIVHRLDKETTGLVVVAKNDRAHLSLSEQLQRREAGREYLALALGGFGQEEGRIDLPIGRHPKDRKRMAVVREGREAITHWHCLQKVRGATLLRVRLETGRTHQIRVHMASQGHPVLGDALYGPPSDKTPVLMLHACRLRFVHPATGETVSFDAPPPEDFLKVLKARGGEGMQG